jgi:hypothetical protein
MKELERVLRPRHIHAKNPRSLKRAAEAIRAAAALSAKQRGDFARIDDLLDHASAETVAAAKKVASAHRSRTKPEPKVDPGFAATESGAERYLPAMLQARRYSLNHWLYRTALAVESGRSGDVLLVNDTRSQNNIGCRTTTNALIDGLAARGHPAWHSVVLQELITIRRNCGLDAAPSPEQAVETFLTAPALDPYRTLIARSRLVLVNAEGSFYDRQVKGLAACVLAIAARRLGAKVAIVNHSAALTDPVMRAYVVAAYEAADFVSLREARSAAFLSGAGDRVEVSADAAFTHVATPIRPLDLPARLPRTFPDDTLDIAIGPRPVLIGGSSVLLRPDRDPVDVRAIGRLCDRIVASGRSICLYSADEADNRVLRPIALRMGVPLLPASWGIEQIGPVLAGASALISGRWHASILAACFGTPSILGDANFFKTAAFHDVLGLDLPMFDYATLDADADGIIAALDRIEAGGADLREAVRAKAVEQAALANATLDHVAAMLD